MLLHGPSAPITFGRGEEGSLPPKPPSGNLPFHEIIKSRVKTALYSVKLWKMTEFCPKAGFEGYFPTRIKTKPLLAIQEVGRATMHHIK